MNNLARPPTYIAEFLMSNNGNQAWSECSHLLLRSSSCATSISLLLVGHQRKETKKQQQIVTAAPVSQLKLNEALMSQEREENMTPNPYGPPPRSPINWISLSAEGKGTSSNTRCFQVIQSLEDSID